MAHDKNAKHLRDNLIGAALFATAFVLMVVVSATGSDPLRPQHVAILILDALGAAWFSCGALKGLRRRYLPRSTHQR